MNQKQTEVVGQEYGQQTFLQASGGFLEKLKTPVFWFAIGFGTAFIMTRKKKAQVIKV